MRKQLLLGTTALLAGAVAMPEFASAEDPLRLSVRGYKNEFFGIGSIDVDSDSAAGTDTGNTSHFSDGEVHFKGETALDNGLTVGVQIELEANNNGDQIDEAYTYVSGSFGKFIFGSENLPNYLNFWGVTAPNVGVPINSGWISVWVPPASGIATGFRVPMQSTNLELRNDNFGMSYTSPSFAGFSFNVGYAPTSAGGSNSGDPKNAPTNKNTENSNIIGLGANYKGSFGGVDLGLAVGYNRATVSDNADAAGANDPQQIKVGASIGVAGFTIAGSYANEFEGQTNATNTNSTEGQAFDVGVSYGMGPWGVSATYFHGQTEQTIAVGNDDKVWALVGAVSYSIGPGITTSFSVIHADWEGENGGTENSKGTLGILGLAVGF
jgi:predicted porin